MARIAGANIPSDKRVEVALTYIYGIGLSRSQKILSELRINPDTHVKDLTEAELTALRKMIETSFKVEGDLKREVLLNIKRLQEISCYRGTRHMKRLPVRGQRTRTNTRTVRGNVRKTMGSGKKPTAQKT